MYWLALSLIAALATSLTTIFSKIGLKNVNSNFATLYRTSIVIIFAFLMCLITGSLNSIASLTLENYVFLLISGLCTGLSWLCYFKALKFSNVNKVAPIDKSSFILTTILFLIFFFDSTTHNGDIKTIIALIVSIVLMLIGTLLMVVTKNENTIKNKTWLIYAILSSVFAALVTFFVKLGLQNINSNVGTFLRTLVVFAFALAIVLFKKDYKGVKIITIKGWLFLTLSSIATGIAWLSEYAAYNVEGSNAVTINSIGKLAILFTMLFSIIVLKEKFTFRSIIGLIFLTAGIILIVAFSL